MRTNNVLGLIYSNAYDDALPELTALRTMGSVPFGGRYRLIDFVLSNMVNCGITKIGVATKANYQSLMDHIGSGKPWDLARKHGGLYLLPPFSLKAAGGVDNRIEVLQGSMDFLFHSTQEYVILSDCNVVCNIDLGAMLERHIASGADITAAYKRGVKPALSELMSFALDGDERVREISVGDPTGGEENYSLNIFLLRKALLERLIQEAAALHFDNFERDIFHRNVENLKICGFEDSDKPVIMVVGGSLGAANVNSIIRKILPRLTERFNVLHLCGKGKLDEDLVGTKGYFQLEYAKEEMKDLFAMADVIISRAGANAICEIVALKKPNILIPLPAKSSRGDQLLNAESFASQGYSKVLDQDTLSPELLADTVSAVYADRDSYIHAMEKSTMQNAIPVIISLIKNTIGK